MIATHAAVSRFRSIIVSSPTARRNSSHVRLAPKRPSIAPKFSLDIKHIRENPDLYTQTCVDRNYLAQKDNPQRIIHLFNAWKQSQVDNRGVRRQSNNIHLQLGRLQRKEADDLRGSTFDEQDELLLQAEALEPTLTKISEAEADINDEIQSLAAELPNLTSQETPIGKEARVIGYINEQPAELNTQFNHVDIGKHLDLLDFTAASTTSGWGWYFLKDEGALLEQALIQYALSVAIRHGFAVVSPPSMVYTHIASACGFQPRDQGEEQQSYTIAQKEQKGDVETGHEGKPEMTLAGTAEIPFAGMKANAKFEGGELPLHVVGASRCYRAEAGARGTESKGLYRVHEFTKVEMFSWTVKGKEVDAFESMLAVQKEILRDLGLHCRIQEMPSSDLGASASRKIDIEAFFPSRRNTFGSVPLRQLKNDGYGEVTSASICTDYQTRRLNTRLSQRKSDFPYTVNGTALAVPRVLAALLENGWSKKQKSVKIPEVLHKWMHGITTIEKKLNTEQFLHSKNT
ncbi:MAG: hypothetical protein Q9176_006838 [Flavoplaca citrina]